MTFLVVTLYRLVSDSVMFRYIRVLLIVISWFFINMVYFVVINRSMSMFHVVMGVFRAHGSHMVDRMMTLLM